MVGFMLLGFNLASLRASLWLRELFIVLLIVITLAIFYRRYVFYARQKTGDPRRRRSHLDNTVFFTRWVLIALVLVLVGTVTYDRILPHWGLGAKTTTVAEKTPVKQVKKTKAAASSQSSAKKTSTTDSSTTKKTKTVKKAKKSTKKTKNVTAQHAVAIVQDYYENNPSTVDDTSSVTYDFIQETRDANGSLVYDIGGYDANQQQIHDYEVHQDGKFDVNY